MATADSFGLFWNSDNGDRKYNADSFERWLRKFFTSGVFEGDLQVLASSGMTVMVQTGYANLFGKVGLFETVSSITLDTPNSRYPRIDTIVVERDDTNRIIQVKNVTGAYSGDNPQPTTPTWDETSGIYQLVLAQIYVGAGVSEITQADITDTRTDTTICGYITGTVQEMDFSQFAAQFESYFEQFEDTNQAEFEDWFQEMKDQLSTDAAGHLQAEIDEINGDISDINTALSGKTDNTDFNQLVTFVGKKLAAQTLAVGASTLTFTDVSITTDSTIEAFYSVYGIAAIDITVTTGQAVLTFDVQEVAVSVYLIIR